MFELEGTGLSSVGRCPLREQESGGHLALFHRCSVCHG
jgi:hypothetical protein